MILRTYTIWYKHHLTQLQSNSTPKKDIAHPSISHSHPSTSAHGIPDLLSVYLPLPDTWYKRNQTICSLRCGFFHLSKCFKLHPHCSMLRTSFFNSRYYSLGTVLLFIVGYNWLLSDFSQPFLYRLYAVSVVTEASVLLAGCSGSDSMDISLNVWRQRKGDNTSQCSEPGCVGAEPTPTSAGHSSCLCHYCLLV